MKKTFIAFMLVLSIVFSLFSVQGSDYTSFLVNEGVISGDEKGFRENDFLTRCEFVKMVNRAFKLTDKIQSSGFSDVKKDEWFYNDICIAEKYGYIKGNEKGLFKPYDVISREEAVTIIGRLVGNYKYSETAFKDNNLISMWAKGAVSALNENKIISGDEKGNFNPHSSLTRFESFIIFTKLLDRETDGAYLISSPFDLYLLNIYPHKNFSLTDNIDLNEKNLPLPLCEKGFLGTFNGNSKKISNLTTKTNDYALFSSVEKEGTVTNLILVCSRNFASITKTNKGLIEFCANTSFSSENQNYQNEETSGGIAGINNGIINGCYISSDLKASSFSEIGGITGTNNGTVSNCFSVSNGGNNTYGLAVYNNSLIKNSFVAGNTSPVKKNKGDILSVSYTEGNSVYGNKVSYDRLFDIYYSSPFKKVSKFPFPVIGNIPFSYGENKDEFAGGSGTKNDPFLVSETVHFTNVKNYPEAYFKQTKDIDLSLVYNYVPIGTTEKPFTGEYDGNGFKIKNLYITDADTPALFGVNKGVVKNFSLENAYIKSFNSASSVIYENHGLCQKVFTDAVIDAPATGGIIYKGYDSSNITLCVFAGKINAFSAGGIIYENGGNISNSLYYGSDYCSEFGGISYKNEGDIFKNCSLGNTSSLNSDDIYFYNRGNVFSCYYNNSSSAENCYMREPVQYEFPESFRELDFNFWEIAKTEKGFVPLPQDLNKFILNYKENFTEFAGGNGTKINPYKIATPVHFKNIANYPESAFILINDLDLSYINSLSSLDFYGYLDGNSFKISGFDNDKNLGIFKTNYGVIKNLSIKTSSDKTTNASVCETNNNILWGIKVYADLSGETVGGICVTNNGFIANTSIEGNITAVLNCGGITSDNNGIIKNVLVTSDIKGCNKNSEIYGIAKGSGFVENSFFAGSLFFEDGIGTFIPVSDSYVNSYYFDRYSEKFDGCVNFSSISDKSFFKGFDFENLWTFNSLNIPVLKSFKETSFNLPTPFQAGDGSDLNPYVLASVYDLYNIRLYPYAHFILAQDINCMALSDEVSVYNNGGKGFTPITDFYGQLDGNNNKITGLEILYSDKDDVGFIKNLYGSVINTNFYDCRIEGKSSVGMVASVNHYLIDNVSVTSSRIGASDGISGGIAGYNKGNITNSYNRSDVFSSYHNGGIAGFNEGDIVNCANFGGIITLPFNELKGSGGIAGLNKGNISSSYNSGVVKSFADSHYSASGGITGENYGYIINCYNTASVSSKSTLSSYAGGITGIAGNTSYISDVYNTGYILCDGIDTFNGSLAGYGEGIISNSFYDNTLTSPFEEENFSRKKVTPLSPEQMTEIGSFTNFSKSKWTIKDNFPYPQLLLNPHKTFVVSENIRDFAGGDGTNENPYKIITPQQLDNVRKHLGSTFILLANIDVSPYCETNDFKPIGDNIFVFYGNFIGNGKTVSGISQSGLEKGGLFSNNIGEIHNLATQNFDINASISGNIASVNSGLIYGCINVSDIYSNTDNSFCGGIAGLNKTSGMIIYSINSSTISATGNNSQAGGICYGNYGIVAGSFNSGDYVFSEGNTLSMAGGITSFNYGTVSDCYSNADIYSTGVSGGISATNSGNLINCYTTANKVFGKTSGGISGNGQNSFFSGCYYPKDKIPSGIADGNHDGIIGVNTQDLYIQSTFEFFDFENMWIMIDGYCPLILETIE